MPAKCLSSAVPTALLAFLFLLSSFPSLVTSTVVVLDENETTYTNFDFWNKEYPEYSITGRISKVQLSNNNPCHVASVAKEFLTVNATAIPIVIWEEALAVGCTTYSDLIDQIFALFGISSPPVMIFSSNSPDFDQDYTWEDQENEPYGKYLRIATQTRFTMVSNRTAYLLLSLNDTMVTVTKEISPGEIFFHSPLWLALVWIRFSIWVCIFLYVLIQLGFFFYETRKLIVNHRVLVFIFGGATCFLRVIETGIDPYQSTGNLGKYGHGFIWWFTFIFLFYAILAVLLAWVQIVQATTYHFTSRKKKLFRYSLRTVAVLITICLTFLAATPGPFTNYLIVLVVLVVYILLIPLLGGFGVIILIFGIKILGVLKATQGMMQGKDNEQRRALEQKTTNIVISIMINELILLICITTISIVSSVYPKLDDTPVAICMTTVVFDVCLISLLLPIFLCLRFKKFGVIWGTRGLQSNSNSEANDHSKKPEEIEV